MTMELEIEGDKPTISERVKKKKKELDQQSTGLGKHDLMLKKN